MDIYITDLETEERLRVPMLPEELNVKTGAVFQTYAVMGVGDVRLPAGQQPTAFSWEGVLPGRRRMRAPYVREWRSPKAIQQLWSEWRAGKKKLRLMATGTPINHDVYLDRYSVTYSGGQGDYGYSIEFVQARDLSVRLAAAPGQAAPAQPAQARPSPPPAATYTVRAGDSLWSIAQATMGGGGRYGELYEANRAAIDARNSAAGAPKHTIYVGQELAIPSPAPGAPPAPKKAKAAKPKAPAPSGGGGSGDGGRPIGVGAPSYVPSYPSPY